MIKYAILDFVFKLIMSWHKSISYIHDCKNMQIQQAPNPMYDYRCNIADFITYCKIWLFTA